MKNVGLIMEKYWCLINMGRMNDNINERYLEFFRYIHIKSPESFRYIHIKSSESFRKSPTLTVN